MLCSVAGTTTLDREWVTKVQKLLNLFQISRNFRHHILFFVWLVCDVKRQFQQYISYIVVVSFIAGGTGVPAENHLPVTRL